MHIHRSSTPAKNSRRILEIFKLLFWGLTYKLALVEFLLQPEGPMKICKFWDSGWGNPKEKLENLRSDLVRDPIRLCDLESHLDSRMRRVRTLTCASICWSSALPRFYAFTGEAELLFTQKYLRMKWTKVVTTSHQYTYNWNSRSSNPTAWPARSTQSFPKPFFRHNNLRLQRSTLLPRIWRMCVFRKLFHSLNHSSQGIHWTLEQTPYFLFKRTPSIPVMPLLLKP